MNEHDLLLIRTLVLAHGLSEVLSGLSSVCSTLAVDLAATCAHRANQLMAASVELDAISVEYETTSEFV